MPRSTSILLGMIGFPLAHAGLPWAVSLLARRHGWSAGRPGRWNLFGLVPAAAGTVYAGWGLALHSLNGWQWSQTQDYFLRHGPYRYSRNPMYVGELALWLGWATFFGSVSVSIGFLTFLVGLSRYVVPQEERALEARYGEAYRQYKHAVPRWL